jgi:PIN domain nuclease of toxin-antitoxin system
VTGLANGMRILPVTLSHVLSIESLPQPHKDPFDRLLVAQALAENAVLISADPVFSQYPVSVVW